MTRDLRVNTNSEGGNNRPFGGPLYLASQFFPHVSRDCRANGGIDKLTIMAHGIEVSRETETGTVNDGGYGIIFCREAINLDTVGINIRNTAAPAGATDEA